MLGEQQVGDDDDRALIFFREVKGFDGGVEAIGSVLGRDNDAREIARGCAVNLVEIGLLLLGGNTRGRPAALHFDEDDRRFDHAGHADRFGHQGETAAGGGAHGARTGIIRRRSHTLATANSSSICLTTTPQRSECSAIQVRMPDAGVMG